MIPSLAMFAALWVGIQTSISPCPLATNIAAIAFLSRSIGNPRRVLALGAVYTLGRTATYIVLSVAILRVFKDRLTAGSALSVFLQTYGLMALGPVLILLGMILLDMLEFGGFRGFDTTKIQARAAAGGFRWAAGLGVLFALSFCPASAGLFFLIFMPIAAAQNSVLVLPLLYGVGTALPVVAFTILMAFAAQSIGRAMNGLTVIEKWVRLAAGVIFIGAGIYYTLTVIYGIQWS